MNPPYRQSMSMQMQEHKTIRNRRSMLSLAGRWDCDVCGAVQDGLFLTATMMLSFRPVDLLRH
jgi:hypothetical protein